MDVLSDISERKKKTFVAVLDCPLDIHRSDLLPFSGLQSSRKENTLIRLPGFGEVACFSFFPLIIRAGAYFIDLRRIVMANERSYLVKTETGEELGPVDQEALVRLTENGRITPDALVRSVLVPRWDKAVNIPFLKPLLLEKQVQRIMEKEVPWSVRIKNRATLRAEDSIAMNSLVKVRAENFDRAPIFSRIFAAIIDLFVVMIGCLLLTGCCYILLKQEVLTTENAAYFLLLLCWFWINFYYVFMISVKTQTIGQKFWGIFLVRNNSMKFFSGRSFFYLMFMILFGFFTPLHTKFTPSKRSFQEILTGTRMVKTKLADNSRIR